MDLLKEATMRVSAVDTIHVILRSLTASANTGVTHKAKPFGGFSAAMTSRVTSAVVFTPSNRRCLQLMKQASSVDTSDSGDLEEVLSRLMTSLHGLASGLLSTSADAGGFNTSKDVAEIQGYFHVIHEIVQWVVASKCANTHVLTYVYPW